jgi:hypothetical protein
VPAPEGEGDPDDGRGGAGGEQGLLAGELRPAVDAQRRGCVVFPDERPVAPEHEIGREGHDT